MGIFFENLSFNEIEMSSQMKQYKEFFFKNDMMLRFDVTWIVVDWQIKNSQAHICKTFY